jgi:hypothetical protein
MITIQKAQVSTYCNKSYKKKRKRIKENNSRKYSEVADLEFDMVKRKVRFSVIVNN